MQNLTHVQCTAKDGLTVFPSTAFTRVLSNPIIFISPSATLNRSYDMLIILTLCFSAQPLHIAHVPKTGGTVLKLSLQKCGIDIVEHEAPWSVTPKITLIRNPLRHIPSMYAHCRAAKYLPHKGLPRGDNVSHGFNLWLDAALRTRATSRDLHFGFLSCYQPWQFQTTFFGPSLTSAIQALDGYTLSTNVNQLLAHYNCTPSYHSHGKWP